MRTGASRNSNASSWTIAATLSPMPPVRESSWTISILWHVRASVNTAARSSGARLRRSRTLASMPSWARRSATRSATWTYAPYDTSARSGPVRRIAVQRDVFVIQDRIGIGDRGCHQRACVVRRARHDDFQSGGPIEPRFGVLRVIRSRVPQSAPRHPHDHRNAAAPSVPDFGGVVDQLIEPGGDEVVELDLANRTL